MVRIMCDADRNKLLFLCPPPRASWRPQPHVRAVGRDLGDDITCKLHDRGLSLHRISSGFWAIIIRQSEKKSTKNSTLLLGCSWSGQPSSGTLSSVCSLVCAGDGERAMIRYPLSENKLKGWSQLVGGRPEPTALLCLGVWTAPHSARQERTYVCIHRPEQRRQGWGDHKRWVWAEGWVGHLRPISSLYKTQIPFLRAAGDREMERAGGGEQCSKVTKNHHGTWYHLLTIYTLIHSLVSSILELFLVGEITNRNHMKVYVILCLYFLL